MVGLDCKVKGCERLLGREAMGIGIKECGGCGPWPKFDQRNCGGVKGRRGPKGRGGGYGL